MEAILYPLWNAYHTMLKGRLKRSPLQIDSAERRIRMNKEGGIASIEPAQIPRSPPADRGDDDPGQRLRRRNAGAEEDAPAVPRPRRAQSGEAVQPRRLPDHHRQAVDQGRAATTKRFNKLLDETRDGPHAEVVNEVVLRTQMQAIYSAENVGHFGLNLDRYAHFTSPIRRYSDLIVHRGLIRALGSARTA
jgi:ribonuclease R